MRNTRYRAWDTVDKVMIHDKQEFIPLRVTNIGVFKRDPFSKKDRWKLLPRDRVVLMECREDVDKEGTFVYEGDIVELDHGLEDYLYVVHYALGGLQLFAYVRAGSTVRGISEGINKQFLEECDCIRVVGDVFRNNDLLRNYHEEWKEGL